MPPTPGSLLPRIATGIPGLDHITGGGLPEGEVTLLAGGTGTGKTVIAGQFLAAGITRFAEPGVFVTLEEPVEKIRRFMGTFGWEVPRWEAERRWAFVDASSAGEHEVVVGEDFDLTALVDRVAAAVELVEAKRLVIDSLSHVLARLGNAPGVRSQLHRLVGGLEALGVTSLTTAERDHEYDGVARYGVEEFVADNIVIVRNVLAAEKRRRTIEALKLRGAMHLGGEFPFAILPEQGATIVALSELELTHPSSEARVSFGNRELDAMCGGGPFQDSVILVSGPTGTGKTLLSLEFLDAADGDQRGLLVAFEESAQQLARHARGWGYDLDRLQADGRIRVLCQYPESAPLESHLVEIQHAVEEFKPARVVIDSLSGIERDASARDFHEFLLGLNSFLKARGITALLTTTTASLVGGGSATGIEASTLLDTIVLLRYVEVYGELRRGIAVLKMRGSDHEKTIRELTIGSHGSQIGAAFRTTTGILAGHSLQLLGEERQRVSSSFREPHEPTESPEAVSRPDDA
jgi:circadian clock protein KaiC